MFTGIIRELGTVAAVERTHGLVRLTVAAPHTASQVHPLESVAVNGVCLSVVRRQPGTLTFEMIRETQRLTTLGTARPGSRVNVEPSLSVCDRLNGHLVFGHVDGLGTVTARHRMAGELVLTIRVPAPLRRFLVPKGPVTVDGVSLTVGQTVTRSTFAIHVIPESLRRTTLGDLKVGDRVNVELDYFAKLVRQFVHAGRDA